jgi:hypothetical protein
MLPPKTPLAQVRIHPVLPHIKAIADIGASMSPNKTTKILDIYRLVC